MVANGPSWTLLSIDKVARNTEAWNKFFTCQSSKNSEREQKESAMDKGARLQHIKNAKHGMSPGRRGGRVFFWDKQDGFHIDMLVSYENYIELWSQYHCKQQHYDAFHDEWDLSEL